MPFQAIIKPQYVDQIPKAVKVISFESLASVHILFSIADKYIFTLPDTIYICVFL